MEERFGGHVTRPQKWSWRGRRGEGRATSKVCTKRPLGSHQTGGEHVKESHEERALGVGFASLTASNITWEGFSLRNRLD